MEEIKPTHRHYKGGLYRLLRHATNEADLAPVVVYQSCEDGRVWVRPEADFLEVLSDNEEGNRYYRFEPIGR